MNNQNQDRATLEAIANTLWPCGDPENEWDSETIERVAELLREAGYGPGGKP